MITLPSLSLLDQGAPRIWLSVEPTDMRRGFDRLAEQARVVMGCDPRSGHPLAQRLLARASTRDLPPAEVTFDLTSTVPTVTALKRFIGSAGDLLVTLFSVESPSQAEDHVIVSAVTDSGEVLPEELAPLGEFKTTAAILRRLSGSLIALKQ